MPTKTRSSSSRSRTKSSGGKGSSSSKSSAKAPAKKSSPPSRRARQPKTVAEARAGVGADGVTGPVGGLVDQSTRRDASDVLQGHFCTIDRTAKGVDTDLLPEGRDGYGVYIEPASLGEDGYPLTALVRLRDDSHATIVVPYAALRPADAGGR